MKILKTIQDAFIFLGIIPIEDQINCRKQFMHYAIGAASFIVIVLSLVAGLLAAINQINVDTKIALYAVFVTIGLFLGIFNLLSLFIHRERVIFVINQFQKFYDETKVLELRIFFDRANELSQKISKFTIINFIRGYLITTIFMATISVMYCYMTKGNVNADELFVPYRFVLPWNQNSIDGWIGTIFYCLTFSAVGFPIYSVTFSFFVAIALYFDALHQCFEVIMSNLSNHLTIKSFHKRDIYTKTVLRETFQYFIDVKTVFANVAIIFNAPNVTVPFIMVVYLATLLYQLDVLIQNITFNLITVFICTLYCVIYFLILCFCGGYTTATFGKYAEGFYDLNWFDLPVQQQKTIHIMIVNMQRPLAYTAFGIVTLNLNTFTEVMQAARSYYLILKTLTVRA